MKLAFSLFNYFPYGGLQRDFLRIAKTAARRGHEIHVYTRHWEGDVPEGFHLHIIHARGWQNHVRCYSFAKKFTEALKGADYDCVIGFNKMPNLDIYYAADVCYQARVRDLRGGYYRLLPRYRQLVALEEAVFGVGQRTQILLLSKQQQAVYEKCYHTEETRFHCLPPGIERDRIAPENNEAIRQQVRSRFGITQDQHLLLMVGSSFKTKGVDRSMRALANLPEALRAQCRLFILGQDNPKRMLPLADELGISEYITFLGGRSDVPHFLLAADVLLHPSYHENTGTAILEAMVAGLPVLTTEVCGYAHYVSEQDAGIVLSSPFKQKAMNAALVEMLTSDKRSAWQQAGRHFAATGDIYSLPDKAVDFIEQNGSHRATVPR